MGFKLIIDCLPLKLVVMLHNSSSNLDIRQQNINTCRLQITRGKCLIQHYSIPYVLYQIRLVSVGYGQVKGCEGHLGLLLGLVS